MRTLNRNLPKLKKKQKETKQIFFLMRPWENIWKTLLKKKKKQEQQNPSTKENEYSDAQMNIAFSSSQAKLCIVFA